MLLPKEPHGNMCRGQKRGFTSTEQTQSSQRLLPWSHGACTILFSWLCSPTVGMMVGGQWSQPPGQLRRPLEPRGWRPAWATERDVDSKTSKQTNQLQICCKEFSFARVEMGIFWKEKKCINYINILCKVL